MASWQAHVAVWMLKLRFKPKLARAHNDITVVRKLFRPPPYRVPRDVTVTPATVGDVAGEWVESAGRDVIMLYLHGGGYLACSAETHRPITAGLARHGLRVFAPDYRLAPEHPFPAALDDAMAVYLALLADGVAPAKIVIAGDSAGGGLTLALLVALRDAGRPLPAAAALFSPWTDLAATGESLQAKTCAMFHGDRLALAAAHYLGAADPRSPLASPLYADLAGLPPLLIHVGADEVLLDDSRRLADRARAAGVPVQLKVWPVVPHVWQIAPTIPEARQSIAETAGFLAEAVAAAQPDKHATAP